jgi:hypothetical protein
VNRETSQSAKAPPSSQFDSCKQLRWLRPRQQQQLQQLQHLQQLQWWRLLCALFQRVQQLIQAVFLAVPRALDGNQDLVFLVTLTRRLNRQIQIPPGPLHFYQNWNMAHLLVLLRSS